VFLAGRALQSHKIIIDWEDVTRFTTLKVSAPRKAHSHAPYGFMHQY
jgi:hypothetical protein